MKLEQKPKAAVIYHRVDTDGVVSGALAILALQSQGYSVDHYPYNYKDEFDEQLDRLMDGSYQTVVLTDISLPTHMMQALNQLRSCLTVIWLDHHQTAIEDSVNNSYSLMQGMRSAEHCATWLTYFWFFGQSYPLLVELVEVLDLHKTNDPKYINAKRLNIRLMLQYQACRKSNKLDEFVVYVQCLLAGGKTPLNDTIKEGALLAVADDSKADQYQCVYLTIGGAQIPAFNYYNNTAIPERAAELANGAPYLAMFTFNSNDVSLSLRSLSEDFDVSGVAAYYGGGGHKMAAGCRVSFEQFSAMLPK